MKKVYIDYKKMMHERTELLKELLLKKESEGLHCKFIRKLNKYLQLIKIESYIRFIYDIIKSIFFWSLSHLYHGYGLKEHKKVVLIFYNLWRTHKIDFIEFYKQAIFPLDSVRYFEFDVFYQQLNKQLNRISNKHTMISYLDVSSPRLLFTILLYENNNVQAHIVNPDKNDLELSKNLLDKLDLYNRCIFSDELIENFNFQDESFDVITCMSVIEHIPGDKDKQAIEKLWKLIKYGGSLMISVPVCSVAYEEYINYFDYGLYKTNGEYTFGQRFYDKQMINDRIITICTNPEVVSIYGEKNNGFYENMFRNKIIYNYRYSFFKEPYRMAMNFKIYSDIDEMPGVGVAFFKFVKEKNK